MNAYGNTPPREAAAGSYLTVREISEALHVAPNTVWRWIKAGKLDSIKIEGTRRISCEAYETFLNRRGE